MSINLIGLFETPHEAQLVYRGLADMGVPTSQLSLIMPDESAKRGDTYQQQDESPSTARRVTLGIGAGALAGGAIGLIAGLAIPGLGILATGPIIALLEGAGLGAIAGGLAGTLVDLGIPDAKAAFYEEGLKAGNALLFARVDSEDENLVIRVMEEHGALEIDRRDDSNVRIGHQQSDDSLSLRS